MGYKLGIGGYQNSGKSFGRRYIPDGENVMIIMPSIKTSHLFTGPAGVEKFTMAEIDDAIKKGTRKAVKPFNLRSPEGKYNSSEEAIALIPDPTKRNLPYVLAMIDAKKPANYFGKTPRNFLTGNIIHCEKLDDLQLYINFVDKWMPWIHTIILPDFTHFISETITSDVFISRKANGEQYAKYLDLAADSLRGFIKSADKLRDELIVVTEYHVEMVPETGVYEIFTPGGKMLKEKFLPSSYYDTFLFTDCKYDENDEDGKVEYRFVTRKVKKYPEARSIGNFDDLYIPNNLQMVLEQVRIYNGIEVSGKIVE